MIGKSVTHYRILKRLGIGGMGEVFLAEDRRLRRRVALKVLPPGSVSDDRLGRFRREARALAALSHPYIVTIHSVEQEGELHFLTMEYVEGGSLAEAIPAAGLPIDRILELAVPIAEALSAAHERGVVHRDLKPSNILLDADGKPKVLDFGLAKLEERREETGVGYGGSEDATELLTREGLVMGTTPYMSPEQLQGGAVDHRTDIFALGVLLYEMSTGNRPFRGRSTAEVVSSVLRDVPEPITAIRGELPEGLGRIVRRCLEKDPADRYPTAAELAADLRAVAEPAEAAAEAPPAPRPRPARRRVVALAATVVLALVLVALFVFRQRPPRAAASDRQTIAVLPFENLTGDPARDYLSAGISTRLVTQLNEVGGIRVVGRAAGLGELGDGGQTARQLGVGSLLEGSVTEEGGRLLVDVRLTDVDSGLLLWSERFEGDSEALLELQRRIGRELTRVLSVPLSRRELHRMAQDPTRSLEAYHYFLRGLGHLEDLSTPRSAESAAALFRQALRLDPEFALAHAALSEALWTAYEHDLDPSQLDEAEGAARQALALDAELPAAQLALARILRSRGRSAESIGEIEKILASHPKPDEAQRELAAAYDQLGNLEEAERCLRAAVALREEDWFNHYALGRFLAKHGEASEARPVVERAAELAPSDVTQPLELLATLDLSEGRFDEAVAAYELLPKPIRHARLASNIGTAYYYSSHPDRWHQVERYYRLAIELRPRHALYHGNLADFYLERGRRAEALGSYGDALALIEEELAAQPDSHSLRLEQAFYEAKAEECGSAVPHAEQLLAGSLDTGPSAHLVAMVFALCGETEPALEALRRAVDLGFPAEVIRRSSELDSLAGDPRFEGLTAAAE